MPLLASVFLFRVPLVIEVWDREKQKNQSNLLGTVQLALLHVLQEQKARAEVCYLSPPHEVRKGGY